MPYFLETTYKNMYLKKNNAKKILNLKIEDGGG